MNRRKSALTSAGIMNTRVLPTPVSAVMTPASNPLLVHELTRPSQYRPSGTSIAAIHRSLCGGNSIENPSNDLENERKRVRFSVVKTNMACAPHLGCDFVAKSGGIVFKRRRAAKGRNPIRARHARGCWVFAD